MMKLTLVFLILYVALPPSKSSGNSQVIDESSLSPAVIDESSLSPEVSVESSLSPAVSNASSLSTAVIDESNLSPATSDELSLSSAVRNESSLSFAWMGPRSLRVTNKYGDEDEIKLGPAPGIGGVQIECLFTGHLVKDLGGSAGVVGCHNSIEVTIIILSNYSAGTMFTLINENKTVELLDSSFDVDHGEELDRSKRGAYYEDDDYIYEYDYSAFDGADPIPPNLYYSFSLGFDESILNKFGGNKTATKEYIAIVTTLAQTYFKSDSLGTRIHFDIKGNIKYLRGKEFKINPKESGAKSSLADSQTIETSEPLIIFTKTDDSENFRGVARIRGACNPTLGRAILKHREQFQRAALTMAHEIGHLFGKLHDSDEDKRNARKPLPEITNCQGRGIMTDAMNKPAAWSVCSSQRLFRWYTNYGKECLKTAPTCDNSAFSGPCSCGVANSNLCTSQDEGYCHNSTATCMVKESKLKTCQSFPSTPGDLLEDWTAAVWLNDDSTKIVKNIRETAFNALFSICPVVQYIRNGAVHSVYVRTSPIPRSFNAFSVFTHNWISANNELNTDFRLYNDLQDAKNDRGAWNFCNYDDGPGYPRDCGKSGRVTDRWFRMPNRGQSSGITSGIGFDIYTGSICPSTSTTRDLMVAEWTAAVWLNDNSTQIVKNIRATAFNALFSICPAIQYIRNGAVHSVYVRTSPFPCSFNAFSVFTQNWISANNELNTDFRLYDDLEDAKNDRGAWNFCNYDDGPGYPRDCGKYGRVNSTWFRMPNRGQSTGITSGIGFDIYTGSECPSPLGRSLSWVTEAAWGKMAGGKAGNPAIIVSDANRDKGWKNICRFEYKGCWQTGWLDTKKPNKCHVAQKDWFHVSNSFEILVNPGNNTPIKWINWNSNKKPFPTNAVYGSKGCNLIVGRYHDHDGSIFGVQVTAADGKLYYAGWKNWYSDNKKYDILTVG